MDKQKADRRFDNLRYPILEDDQIIDYQDALDQLNLGEMPPEDQPQPQPVEVSKVVAWLTAAISEAQANRDSSGGETVLRRLNRREYRYTFSVLLNLNMGAYDPTAGFPSDK